MPQGRVTLTALKRPRIKRLPVCTHQTGARRSGWCAGSRTVGRIEVKRPRAARLPTRARACYIRRRPQRNYNNERRVEAGGVGFARARRGGAASHRVERRARRARPARGHARRRQQDTPRGARQGGGRRGPLGLRREPRAGGGGEDRRAEAGSARGALAPDRPPSGEQGSASRAPLRPDSFS